MSKTKRVLILAMAVVMVMFSLGGQALAKDYPSKNITLFVAFPAGGILDAIARSVAPGAEEVLGKNIVIINKPGGGGTVALSLLKNQKPDGYNLCLALSTQIVSSPLTLKVNYKPLVDFTNIYALAYPAAAAVVTKSDSPYKTFKEFIEYAKKNRGKITYGTGGAGTVFHAAMGYVNLQENLKMKHVPYPGTAAALTAVLGGHVDIGALGPSFIGAAKGGKLTTLAGLTGKRMPMFRNVPTLRETGYDYALNVIFSIFGPAGMDKGVVKKLEDAFAQGVDGKKFQTLAKKRALVPVKWGSEKYTQFLNKRWDEEVKLFTDLGLIKGKPATEPR